MKVITNTLKLSIDRWDDPGDYPSGAGSSPLPSHDYVEEVGGSIAVELETPYLDGLDTIINEPQDIDHGVGGLTVLKWTVVGIDGIEKGIDGEQLTNGPTLTLEVEQFEATVQGPEDDCDAAYDYWKENSENEV